MQILKKYFDVIVITIAYDYRIDLLLKKAQKIITKNESVWTTKTAYYFIIEVLLLIPHPNLVTKGKKLFNLNQATK